MRWKKVALAGALGPAAAGCHLAGLTARHPAHDPPAAPAGLAHDLRADARAAWREVRAEYPRRAFSAEFRDGFLDGYVDYLDRGGDGVLPAVPPARYTQHKKYFTPDGQCLVKEYFLGFKYGQDVAVATGKRQYLTVPVLLPQHPADAPPVVYTPPRVVTPTAPQPTPMPTPTPPPGPGSDSPPRPAAAPPAPPVVGASGTRLPPPPPEVPALPDHVPTPPVRDELPIIVLPTHADPPIVLPSHPELTGR
ncbi:MAG: hypothetical protein C0501_04290 [Isosphaera sp.]|nr:hypothetical protein [Isosphaera sp.]